MIILVEGNEGSGKTTLINTLLKKIDAVCIKCSKNIKNVKDLYLKLPYENELIIFDRSFITDMVYRNLDYGKGQMSLYDIMEICSKQEFKIIFCNNVHSFERSMTRGEDNITDVETHEKIDILYKFALNLIRSFTEIEILYYDYEYDSVDDVIKFIKGGNDNDTVSI